MFGSSTAGGAYVPGMCDHTVFVRDRARVFLGGPPLVKMATGEEADAEELGGAEMHSRTSGLSDYLADDEHDALRLGRDIVRRLNWRKLGPGPSEPADAPLYDPEELLGVMSVDRRPFDPADLLARVVDGSRFDAFKPLYGTALITGWASLHGYPIGVLANVAASCSPRRRRRPRSSSSSPTSATSRCCSCTTRPASWSARSTSRAASSSTARR